MTVTYKVESIEDLESGLNFSNSPAVRIPSFLKGLIRSLCLVDEYLSKIDSNLIIGE
jgi:hypothetical protein